MAQVVEHLPSQHKSLGSNPKQKVKNHNNSKTNVHCQVT
jgi:hypothetical protein